MKKTGARKRPLPAWLSILVIVAVLCIIGVVFVMKTRGPSSHLPEATPELRRIQQEIGEYLAKHPEGALQKREKRGLGRGPLTPQPGR